MDHHVRFFSALFAIVRRKRFPACRSPAQAQSYPSRAIHLVTGNPPGGATDFIARAIGQPLSVRLGQGVVIDNRPGRQRQHLGRGRGEVRA